MKGTYYLVLQLLWLSILNISRHKLDLDLGYERGHFVVYLPEGTNTFFGYQPEGTKILLYKTIYNTLWLVPKKNAGTFWLVDHDLCFMNTSCLFCCKIPNGMKL